MAIHRYTVPTNEIIDPAAICSGATVEATNPQCIAIVCQNATSIEVEINTDLDCSHCVTFAITCPESECQNCGTIYVTKCFCVNSDDCGDCETCTGHVCLSTCAEGKVCNNDTCSDCLTDADCPCDQECNGQGSCVCPNGLKKDLNGCCVECFDGEDLGPCLVCYGGVITAKDCNGGHCNQNTGDCQECLNNSHCSGANECCDANGNCSCCPGYVLDFNTNQCVPQPPCNNAQDCVDQFGPCYYCTVNGCAPKPCPAGFVCDPNTGECVPGCVNGVCPEGYGCLNGRCVPCSELSCNGEGELCEFAVGCQCVGLTCEYINCNAETVDLEWVVNPSTPGQPVPGTGLPALQGTANIVALAMVYGQAPFGSGYYNHQFNLSVNGTNGSWVLENTPGNLIPLGSGTSVSFDLTSTGPNLVGFIVTFTETGTGRTAKFELFRTPTAPINQPNVWNSNVISHGTPASTTGGTQGSVQLCATNGNFIPTGVTNVVTTDSMNITFIPTGTNCMTAVITGCGTWNGDVILSCGGQTVTVAAPEFTKDPANCCDPLDPNCGGWGTGEPCGDLTIQPIDLVLLPTFGHTASGDGEFLVVADWTTAGLSFSDLFYLNPAPGCWSVFNSPGDATIVTAAGQSPLGPSPSHLAVTVTMGDGGCVRFGHTCELRISGCKQIQGEICLEQCDLFEVDIVASDSTTYHAIVSILDQGVTYQWFASGGTITNPTGSSITWTSPGGSAQLCVSAKYGNPVECTDQACLVVNTQTAGCTNALACNYNSAANIDDNTCVLVGEPSYSCALGGFQPGLISAIAESTPAITYYIGGNVIQANEALEPGTYTVDVYFNGVQKCSKSLTVPQCYRCSAGVCIPSPVGDNTGPHTTSNCNSACSCDIEINVTQVCSNNRSALVITATGDTGTYTVTVNKVGGEQVVAPTTMNTAGSVTTPLVCNGVYRILVQGVNCNKSRDYTATCYSCTGSSDTLSSYSYDCPTNQLFANITADPCATHYTVSLVNSAGGIVTTQQFTSAGAKTIPLGVYPGDGSYTVRLTSSQGCVKNFDLTLNCNGTLTPCPISSTTLSDTSDGVNTSFTVNYTLATTGGSYSVTIYNTTGGGPLCSGATFTSIITTQTVVGNSGLNTVNFPNAITQPGIDTCYGVKVQKLGAGNENCFDTAVDMVEAGSTSFPCSLTVSNVSYDTATGNVFVSWNGTGTSNDVTVQIQSSGTAVCSTVDPVVVSVAGNGEDGLNIPFGPIHQLSGQPQCITVTIFDTNDSGCDGTYEFEIPACTCSVDIDEDTIFVDSDAETIEFQLVTRCTSGSVTLDLSGDATASGTTTDVSENGTSVTSAPIVLSITGYPSVGGSAVLEAIDASDSGCSDTQNVTLEANCTACSQVATFTDPDAVITEIRDTSGNAIVSGSYDMNVLGDITALEADVEVGVTANGGNFCLTGTKVDANANATLSGITVNQDSDSYVTLDYAVVTSAEWVGDRNHYFGDCGCATGRTCDYTMTADLTPLSGVAGTISFTLYYGDSGVGQFTRTVYVDLGTVGTIGASEIAAIEAAVEAAIANSSCGYVAGAVSASYNSGTMELTLTIPDTNMALGTVVFYEVDGLVHTDYFAFTQSGCV